MSTALAGRYRFDREIGRGGWGTVHLAQDLVRKRAVAIKVMTVGSGFLARRERFRNEIEVGAGLAHPNIVPVFDSGELDEIVYFVMPLIEGESLQERLARDGPLPVREALHLANEVAQALAHAHAHRIVHRDVKPGNIMLTAGHALVADFGLARVLGPRAEGSSSTTDVIGVGTAAYMAPEQADGSAGIDGRADIYSLGCVLFEMLVGRVPFEGRDYGEVLRRHAVESPPSIRTVRPTVAPEVEAIVLRALAKVPADRFGSALEMATALDAAVHADGSSGPRPPPAPFPPRARVALLMLLGIAMVGATTAVIASDRGRARLILDADSARLVVFPLESAPTVDIAADDRLRRALARWTGIAVEDAFVVRDAIGGDSLTSDRANVIALRLGAGRFMRGTVSATGSGVELRLMLAATGRAPVPVHEEVIRVALDERSLDSAFAGLVEGSLIREPIPSGVRTVTLSTRSIPALRAYLRGRSEIAGWNLDAAISAFDEAWSIDRGFGSAALWLALSRYWADANHTTWSLAAFAALRDSLLMTTHEAGAVRALLATSVGDHPEACRSWDALTLTRPFDFVGWYGAAICRDRDGLVVRAARSRSGFAFRSSYQAALARYLRAYQLLPAIHRSLSDSAFVSVRRQLFVSAQFLRVGATREGEEFLASPALRGDTLAFTPFPALAVYMAAPEVLVDAASQLRMERRQRELFRDVAAMWAGADRGSSEAREALALALQLLGDVSALDTIAAAVALDTSGARHHRLAATAVWLRVGFAVPDDWIALARARTIAESVLATDTSSDGAAMRATLAALLGRRQALLRETSRTARRIERFVPGPVADAAGTLTFEAALGSPADLIARAEHSVDSLIVALVPSARRDSVRGRAFTRAARLAWPSAPLSTHGMASVTQDYLVPALHAASTGDSAALRPALARIIELRGQVTPADVSLDALLPETALLMRAGQLALAATWLDEALAATRTTTPDFDPIKAAALVRCMALRAEIATRLGQPAVARRWAGAVVALWDRADPELQPFVARMRALSR